MRLIRLLKYQQLHQQACVLTIGNFDGVHLGHQAVVKKLAENGKRLGLPVVLMLFEPQPLEYFLQDNVPSRLTRLREKVIQLAKLPIDDVVILPFNRNFADYDPEQFIVDILVDTLNVKFLVVGDDFHFGKARRGNFVMLKDKGEQLGFCVEDTDSFSLAGGRISSTLIRDALGSGDLHHAEQMLGRPYSVCGRVSHGQKRGRGIGFPTANIHMLRKTTPIEGVFAVTMIGIDQRVLFGVANVGTRPTINGDSRVILETHLFDFDEPIYGRHVEVCFKEKIRNEIHFQSLQELTQQINKDVVIAKQILAIK